MRLEDQHQFNGFLPTSPPRPPQDIYFFHRQAAPIFFPLVLSLSGQNVNLSSVTSLLRFTRQHESVLIRKPSPIALPSEQKIVLLMYFTPAFQLFAICSQPSIPTVFSRILTGFYDGNLQSLAICFGGRPAT